MSNTEQSQTNGHPQANMEKLKRNMDAIGKKILVLSGKGGVGKSTVAVNIAAELARKGFQVGLLDVDLHGPSIPRMTGHVGQKCFGTEDEILPLKVNDNLKVMSVAFLIGDDTQATIWRGPMKYAVIRKMLADTEWGQLDYLVIDAPPGTGDEPLSIAQLTGAGAGAVLVTTPQQVAVEDVHRCVTFCQQVELPVWGIVENMSGLYCPHCDKEIKIFGTHAGGQRLAEATGLDFLGQLPIDPEIADGADGGRTIAECSVSAHTHEHMDRIIGNLMPKIQTQSEPKGNTMKIAIPTADGQLCMHFGHCEQFAFVTIDEENKTVTAVDMLTPPPHEPGVLPKWVADNGGQLVIAGGMGQRAQQLFNQNQVNVIVGAAPDSPENLAVAYMNGSLQTGQNACDH